MNEPLSIRIDDADLQAALNLLIQRSGRLRPALVAIGENLAESTRRRFETSTGPDGRRWAPNSRVTIERFLDRPGAYSKKTGKISAKGATLATGKKPLVGRTRLLGNQIVWQAGGTSVAIGSNRIQAGVQQFGAAARQFGKAPWGAIPARPFLGISTQDKADILETVADWLAGG
jgi:phage virion morphogenesis protein